MNIIFVDPIVEKVVTIDQSELVNGLPEGWMVPPRDISQDREISNLPFGVVVALSSEESYSMALQQRMQDSFR